MLMAISIGNSHIALGTWDGGSWRKRWRIQTVHGRTADEYRIVLRELFAAAEMEPRKVSSSILASVVPPLTGTLEQTVAELCGQQPMLLGPGMVTGLRITTENPAEVGADLVANAVAAHERIRGSCVVVDFGTALSFTAVSAAGELRGVAIAPGLSASVDALARTTSQLPRIPLSAPPRAIGRNTVHSIQSGVVLGCVSLVEGLIGRIRAELDADARVIVTGGQSPLIAPLLTEPVIVEPWLTLEGLRIVSERTVA